LSTNAPEDFWLSIACSSDGAKLVAAPYYDIAAGNAQPLYVSTDSGTTWTATLTPSNHWTAVASSADGTRLIALPSYGPVSGLDFNKRTGSRLIRHIFVDYEWVGIFEFGKRIVLNKRTVSC
jgi:hypothetical protein